MTVSSPRLLLIVPVKPGARHNIMTFVIMKVMLMGVSVGGATPSLEWTAWLTTSVGACDVTVCVGVLFLSGELRLVDLVKFYCCIVILQPMLPCCAVSPILRPLPDAALSTRGLPKSAGQQKLIPPAILNCCPLVK